jgi:hypothetical protein
MALHNVCGNCKLPIFTGPKISKYDRHDLGEHVWDARNNYYHGYDLHPEDDTVTPQKLKGEKKKISDLNQARYKAGREGFLTLEQWNQKLKKHEFAKGKHLFYEAMKHAAHMKLSEQPIKLSTADPMYRMNWKSMEKVLKKCKNHEWDMIASYTAGAKRNQFEHVQKKVCIFLRHIMHEDRTEQCEVHVEFDKDGNAGHIEVTSVGINNWETYVWPAILSIEGSSDHW